MGVSVSIRIVYYSIGNKVNKMPLKFQQLIPEKKLVGDQLIPLFILYNLVVPFS